MKLYDYPLSSAAYRLRIALNLKGLDYEAVEVHLREARHKEPEYLALNPQGLVPALAIETGETLSQSMAILEYLEETHPEPPFLPDDPVGRARVRAAADAIACDIHPLNNLRVLLYLRGPLDQDEDGVTRWYHEWLRAGFDGLEQMVAPEPFAFGAAPGLVDICLVPQLFNARRFEFDLAAYPKLQAIDAECAKLEAFDKAQPSRQTGG